MFEALYSLSAKNSKEIGPSSNEGLKYRDIESVKFECGKCCTHLFRGSIYIHEPVCYFAKILVNMKFMPNFFCQNKF